jgi:hypothetical protein
VTGALVLPTVYFLYPETSGRSLEEIGRIFEEPKHWWEVPRAARRSLHRFGTLNEAEKADFKAADVHISNTGMLK